MFERGSYAYDLIGLGGAFDHLHIGHKTLLETAFKLGNKVAIGLSTDALLENKSYRDLIQSYEEREAGLRNFIENEWELDWRIIPLFRLMIPLDLQLKLPSFKHMSVVQKPSKAP